MQIWISGNPKAVASILAKPLNEVVVTISDGTPCFSRSTASWRLHDVQDPQSPKPVTAKSQVSFISSMML